MDNPLEFYPSRDWEKKSTVANLSLIPPFISSAPPNDTHNCLLRAYVKNDIITRIGPSYGYGKAKDVYGNQASHRWEPGICAIRGWFLNRRVYGPRRVKYPMVREGFKKWVEAGFPRGVDGKPAAEYLSAVKGEFYQRFPGMRYLRSRPKGLINIATTYSGDSGKALLTQQGYDPAMIEAMKGAGSRP